MFPSTSPGGGGRRVPCAVRQGAGAAGQAEGPGGDLLWSAHVGRHRGGPAGGGAGPDGARGRLVSLPPAHHRVAVCRGYEPAARRHCHHDWSLKLAEIVSVMSFVINTSIFRLVFWYLCSFTVSADTVD